ncbi:MAG: hypothetical protein QM817_07120 [Archangium sp.]
MEGKVEVLEDGILLLESVVSALNRSELDDDDLRTLQEAVNQLPRLNEALDALLSHEAAKQLTAKFAERTRWLQDALTLKLGRDTPSLRAGVSMVLQQARLAPHAPREGETRLLEGKPISQVIAVVVGIVASFVLAGVLESAGALLSAPVLIFLATRLTPRGNAWTLLPDRLHRSDQAELSFSGIESIATFTGGVLIRRGGHSELIATSEPQRLASWLELLRSQWLANLEPKPRAWTFCTARNRDTNDAGLALVVRDGVLFIPTDRVHLALKALSPNVSAPPRKEEFLKLLAHVPEGRWNALGAHLAQACDGVWLARGAEIDDSSGEFLTLKGSQRADAADANSTRGRWELAQVQLSFALDDAGLKQRAFVQSLLTLTEVS